MIVDASAMIAVLLGEAERDTFVEAMSRAPSVRTSAGTLLETAIVVDRRFDPSLSRQFDTLLHRFKVEIVPVDEEQGRIGRAAYRDFGRGSGHRARLNFGDCFAYALASVTGEPLLFKGDNFGHTDIESAV